MITPEVIDQIAETVNELTQKQVEHHLNEIQRQQPAIFAYFMSENETYLLSREEKETLFFMILVVWEAVKQELTIPQRIGMKKIDAIQYDNWQRMEKLDEFPKALPLEEYYEPLIADHEQAELLYFVVDIIDDVDDLEEPFLSKESKTPLFVMLKTIVDALIATEE